MSRFARRVDTHHAAWSEILERHGWLVKSTAALSNFVDAVACHPRSACADSVYLIEFKTPKADRGGKKASLQRSQQSLIDKGFPVIVLSSEDEVMAFARGTLHQWRKAQGAQ